MHPLRNIRSLAIGTAMAGAVVLGAYFHPVPVTNNWDSIAARDMNAKAKVAYDIKSDVAKYSADGKWDNEELLDITSLTYPRTFTEHRISEMSPIFGIFPRYDSLFPSSGLEDYLYQRYNELFREEFTTYGEFQQALERTWYDIFNDRYVVSYDDWFSGDGLDPMRRDDGFRIGDLHIPGKVESLRNWILRQHQGSIDLSKSDLDEQLNIELDKLAVYFSSDDNQYAFGQEAGTIGDSRNRVYNGILLGLASGVVALTITTAIGRRKNETYLLPY